MPLLTYSNLEKTPFTINNTTDVNPWPMQDVQVQYVNGVLYVYMRGQVGPTGELPGALVGFTVPVVGNINGAQALYAGLDYEVKIDDISSSMLQCFESDLKWCIAAPPDPTTSILNVVDGSSQKVYASNGMWQIDNANSASWVNTGFMTRPFPPNQWNKVATRQSLNPAAGEFSFVSITDGAATYNIPPNLQSLPLLKTNWNATGVQFQIALNKTGFATFEVRNVSALFSDQPIPPGN